MLDYVKRYIFLELLLILRVVNYYVPLDNRLNIAVVLYLTLLGLVYLAFKFRYRGGSGSGGVSWAFAGRHVCIVGKLARVSGAMGACPAWAPHSARVYHTFTVCSPPVRYTKTSCPPSQAGPKAWASRWPSESFARSRTP